MTEREARACGRPVLIGKQPMTRVGAGRWRRARPRASGDEAVQCITAIMSVGAPYTVLQRTVLVHPTVSELIPTVLGSLAPIRWSGLDLCTD